MCDIWQANHNKQELTEADLARHLDSFRKFNVRWVVLSGGEALMHRNLWALVNGSSVRSVADLRAAAESLAPGAVVSVLVRIPSGTQAILNYAMDR
jgi:hypothetical protein